MKISNLTKRRIKEFLDNKKRFDNRKFTDYRKVEIETGVSENAEGSARVRIGKTEVVAGIKMNIGEPYPDHDDEGTMITTMELLPLSSAEFDYGPPGIDAIEIARIVDRGIRESGFLDFKKLCVKKGEKVWTIFIDMYSINDDGNLLDASAFAAVSALLTAKMVKYDEKEDKVKFGEFTNKKLPLTKKIPLTFTFHKIGNNIIVDPSKEEDESSEGRLSVAMTFNEKKEVNMNALQKGGEKAFEDKEIIDILELAEKKYKEMFPEIVKEK